MVTNSAVDKKEIDSKEGKVKDLAKELETSHIPMVPKSADSEKTEKKTTSQDSEEDEESESTKESEKDKPIDQMMKYLSDISSEHQSKVDRKRIQ